MGFFSFVTFVFRKVFHLPMGPGSGNERFRSLALIMPDRLDKRRVGGSFLKDKRHVFVSPFWIGLSRTNYVWGTLIQVATLQGFTAHLPDLPSKSRTVPRGVAETEEKTFKRLCYLSVSAVQIPILLIIHDKVATWVLSKEDR
jgi:hypothetical protein